jgi:hypothetical protein
MSQPLMDFVRENALLLLVLLGMAGAFILLRTRGTSFGSVGELDALLATGKPVVVEIYSNT